MSRSQTTHKQINISSEHPSLSGHFPENPVLPGVVILGHVRSCIEEWKQCAIADSQLKSVKFLSPFLLSETSSQLLHIMLQEKTGSEATSTTKIEFRCLQNESLIAQGLWVYQSSHTQ